MSGTRAFVAVGLSDEVRERLTAARQVLLQQAPSWLGEKWVAEENLHITLKFLGSLEDARLKAVRSAVGAALAGGRPFSLSLADLQAVPALRRCSMIWARFDDPDRTCAALAGSVDRAAAACGVALDKRPFKPHVTIVRSRRPKRLDDDALTCANALVATGPISMSVPSVTLFASTLTRTGPVYEAIDSWELPEPR